MITPFTKVDVGSAFYDVYRASSTADVCEWAYHHAQASRAFCPKQAAAVFDVDDTLIDRHGRPIEDVCRLYRRLHEAKIGRFVVTARPERMIDTTMQQLKAIDSKMPVRFFHMAETPVKPQSVIPAVSNYKRSWRSFVDSDKGFGCELMLTIGDEWWDLVGSEEMVDLFDDCLEQGVIDASKPYVIVPLCDEAQISTVARVGVKLPAQT